jgi:glycosyltransferase involved in cell wall biosynthesis
MSRYPRRPLISIVTPCLNAAGTIRPTLESLSTQLADDVEHLLIDACSTDGTLEIAREYTHLEIRSERDCGIYDGMNKGAALASGEWLLFLQADDWVPPGALAAYRQAIKENPAAEVICGSAEAVEETEGRWSPIWSVKDTSRKKLSAKNIALGEPMINARLFRKSLFDKLGGFTLKYSLASDRDFLLRAADAGVLQCEVDSITYRYRWHAGSSTMTAFNSLTARLSSENLIIARKHLEHCTSESRDALLTWHSRLTVQAAMNALERFDPGFFTIAAEGFGKNPVWGLAMAGEVLRSFPGFIMRGFKTRTQGHARDIHND